MIKVNIYIDGTWFFRQCQKENTLARKLYDPTKNFYVDFKKLVNVIKSQLEKASDSILEIGDLWYYTSMIENVPMSDIKSGTDLGWIKNLSQAKERTVENAKEADFDTSGVFRIPSRVDAYSNN